MEVRLNTDDYRQWPQFPVQVHWNQGKNKGVLIEAKPTNFSCVDLDGAQSKTKKVNKHTPLQHKSIQTKQK